MSSLNENYREYKLDNGLLVALQKTPTRTVFGRLRVWHGALNEEQGEEGIAHFLEHALIAGGSKRYDHETADKIRDSFGYFNAYTGLEKTLFPVDMLTEYSRLFLEYISDTVFNPGFEEKKVEEERQRILRETSDTKSNPAFMDKKDYEEAFYGKNSLHTYFILGKEAVISSASVDDLRRFQKRGYHPNNMDLILVGGLPKNIEYLVEKNFGSFKKGKCKKVKFPKNPHLKKAVVLHTYAPEYYNHEYPEQSSAQLSISFVGPTQKNEDYYSVKMLVNILGAGSNSKLFKSLSQRKGLAYGIDTIYDVSNNKGAIHIGGNVHSSRTDEAIDAVFEEMSALQKNQVSQDTLERLKLDSIYSIAKAFETNAGCLGAIELRMDSGITPQYHLEKMQQVTPKKIRDAALKYLPKSREDGKYILCLRDPLKK